MQVHEATIADGAYPSPLNYGSFPKSVCTSVNEVRVTSGVSTHLKDSHEPMDAPKHGQLIRSLSP